jgi:tetratricopeptide (TPR) repeat protein
MSAPSLREAKRLAEAGRYDEAVSICSELLSGQSGSEADALRARAYVFALAGDYDKSSADREAVLRLQGSTLRDVYQSADQALKARNLSLAATRFQETLTRGESEGEAWFKSASMFYLAFIEMELENFVEAGKLVKRVKDLEPECALPIPGVGVVSVDKLAEEVARRAK